MLQYRTVPYWFITVTYSSILVHKEEAMSDKDRVARWRDQLGEAWRTTASRGNDSVSVIFTYA